MDHLRQATMGGESLAGCPVEPPQRSLPMESPWRPPRSWGAGLRAQGTVENPPGPLPFPWGQGEPFASLEKATRNQGDHPPSPQPSASWSEMGFSLCPALAPGVLLQPCFLS